MGRRMQIAVDCSDADGLAQFWAEALGYKVMNPPDGHDSWADFSRREAHLLGERWAIIGDPDSTGPTVLFHTVPEAKSMKNRVHLDVWVPIDGAGGDQIAAVEAEATRLIELGAAHVRTRDEDGDFYIVMQDPEGNEFCIA